MLSTFFLDIELSTRSLTKMYKIFFKHFCGDRVSCVCKNVHICRIWFLHCAFKFWPSSPQTLWKNKNSFKANTKIQNITDIFLVRCESEEAAAMGV